jgi:hypothetical protein
VRVRAIFPAAVLPLVIGLAACGGSSKPAAQSPSTAPSATAASVKQPSVSAKMICADEAKGDIEAALGGVKSQPLHPRWADSTYSCAYVFPTGTMALSVKELPNLAATDAYYKELEQKLGVKDGELGFGSAAFLSKNDDVVSRKDNKVLVVNVQGLPKLFGTPAQPRPTVAINVGQVILGCWTGA